MKPLATAQLPTESGSFEVRAYDSGFHDFPHLVLLSKAEVPAGEVPLVRIHSECWTGDVVGSLKCDCGPQLDASLRRVAQMAVPCCTSGKKDELVWWRSSKLQPSRPRARHL